MRAAAAGEGRGRAVLADAHPHRPRGRLPAGQPSVTVASSRTAAQGTRPTDAPGEQPSQGRGFRTRLRLTSLRLRLVFVFALVALTAAVSASGIAYWLNREALLTRTQDAALHDFKEQMQSRAGALPRRPTQAELKTTADRMSNSAQQYSVLLISVNEDGRTVTGNSDLDTFTLDDVPQSLQDAVRRRQPVTETNQYPYHLYWQRTVGEDAYGTLDDGTPFLVAGTRIIDSGGSSAGDGSGAGSDEAGTTGYMLKSLEPERDDLTSLAWSLGIATALALVGSALLAQAAATTVLKPVQRLGDAARRLGEGKLETRLRVSGTDELADLSRTFNRTAEALEKQVAEMSDREQASRRFVADMSHELRTPLTAITAVSEVLEEEADNLDPMIAPAVQLVVSESRRLNDLVENLMEVTRFDAGTARLVLDHVDIADQITACVDARAWLDAVELDAERGLLARVDPRRLDVILANLIGNALKHGGSPVRVTVTASDTELVIAVRDHGPGIPEDVLPHVFDRFYKASASRPRSEGSGLGLSIALENAHIHGGEITAANSPEGGAVFTLTLPRHTDDEPAEGELS
ncbi:ATP-binding protein [Streptomyces sp. NPDC060194]|uniref:ATP-binding protein n=1 Tax=Streptomyces sp. NPDC060194 TaxID=3347069 RepID=UPI003660C088